MGASAFYPVVQKFNRHCIGPFLKDLKAVELTELLLYSGRFPLTIFLFDFKPYRASNMDE